MTSINTSLFNFINHGLQNPVLDILMPAITELGSFVFITILLVIIFLIAKFKSKEEMKNIILICIVSVLFVGLITLILKYIVNEPRPFMALSNVHLLVVEDDLRSFPSGHTATIFSLITCLTLNIKEYVKHYKAVSCILVVYGIIIGFSRIYVGVHYPIDVIFGAAIGICGSIFISNFEDRILDYYYEITGKFKMGKT